MVLARLNLGIASEDQEEIDLTITFKNSYFQNNTNNRNKIDLY